MSIDHITIDAFCELTKYTPKAVERKIQDGVWLEGHEYVRAPDRRILISIKGYEKWAVGQRQTA